MAYYNKHNLTIISIHVPREGDDEESGQRVQGRRYFNPRPP